MRVKQDGAADPLPPSVPRDCGPLTFDGKQMIRAAAFIILAVIFAVFVLFALPLLPFTRTFVFPKEFNGQAVVVKSRPEIAVPIKSRGIFFKEYIIQIPESGVLPVSSFDIFHRLAPQKVILDDGTVITGSRPWTKRPSRFRESGITNRGVESFDPLSKYKASDGSITYFTVELSSEPIFDDMGNIVKTNH